MFLNNYGNFNVPIFRGFTAHSVCMHLLSYTCVHENCILGFLKFFFQLFIYLLSSSVPKKPGRVYRMVVSRILHSSSSVRRQYFQRIFSLKLTGQFQWIFGSRLVVVMVLLTTPPPPNLSGAADWQGEGSLYIWSRSHDQEGRHALIWQKSLKTLLLLNRWADCLETCYEPFGNLVL